MMGTFSLEFDGTFIWRDELMRRQTAGIGGALNKA